MNIEIKKGSRIWFRGEKRAYTVRASNDKFLVCTKPFNLRHTVLYSIVDIELNIRGTENRIFGMGFETDELCEEALQRLTGNESKISHRNNVPVDVVKIILC